MPVCSYMYLASGSGVVQLMNCWISCSVWRFPDSGENAISKTFRDQVDTALEYRDRDLLTSILVHKVQDSKVPFLSMKQTRCAVQRVSTSSELMLKLLRIDEIFWVGTAIRQELQHVVLNLRVKNCPCHFALKRNGWITYV